MNCYIFQADIYCEECGAKIVEGIKSGELIGSVPEDLDDEYSWDSDDFPKGPYPVGESDSPEHCASGGGCINALTLGDNGEVVDKNDGITIGCWLENDLTEDGVEYVKHLSEQDRKSTVVQFWLKMYKEQL